MLKKVSFARKLPTLSLFLALTLKPFVRRVMLLVLVNQMRGLAIGQVDWRRGEVGNMNWLGSFFAVLLICQRFPLGDAVRQHFGRTEWSSARAQPLRQSSI